MKRVVATAFLVLGVVAGTAWAKDCPSRLQTNLHLVEGTGISYGAELRGTYYLVNQKDHSSAGERFRSDFGVAAADAMVQAELGEHFVGAFQLLARTSRNYVDREFECEYCRNGVRVDVKQAWGEWSAGKFAMMAGRSNYAFGNQLVIDNFFDMGLASVDAGEVKIQAGGGVLARGVARETLGCQHEPAFEQKQCWKRICEAKWGGDRFGLVSVGANLWPRQSQKILVLRSATDYPELDSMIVDTFLNGRLPLDLTYFLEVAAQKYDDLPRWYWGAAPILARNLEFGDWMKNFLRGGFLYGSRDDDGRFAPLFESLWVGERYRYSVYNGKVAFFEDEFSFSRPAWLSYLLRLASVRDYDSNASRSDEVDAGFTVKPDERYRFFFTYSVLNMTGDLDRVQQVKVATRIIL